MLPSASPNSPRREGSSSPLTGSAGGGLSGSGTWGGPPPALNRQSMLFGSSSGLVSAGSATPPTDPDVVKADLARCPQWVLLKMREERARGQQLEQELASSKSTMGQLAVKLRGTLEELETVRSEYEKFKGVTRMALTQSQAKLEAKLNELALKNELIDSLSKRLQQPSAGASGVGSGPKRSMTGGARPKLAVGDPISGRLAYPLASFRRNIETMDTPARSAMMTEVVVRADLVAAQAVYTIAGAKDATAISKAIMDLFVRRDVELKLLERIISLEVTETHDIPTMFRSNSFATKVMSAYTKLVGGGFLKDTVQRLVELVQRVAKGGDLEVDPTKCASPDDADRNAAVLMEVVEAAFRLFVADLPRVPLQFRVVSSKLHERVAAKFGALDWPIEVAGFYFLRFICPAIVAPELAGVTIADASTRRGLMVLSKIVQALANGVSALKETYMAFSEPWIRATLPRCREFLLQLAVVPDDGVPAEFEKGSEQEAALAIQSTVGRQRDKFLDLLKVAEEPLTLSLRLPVLPCMAHVVKVLGAPGPGGPSEKREVGMRWLTEFVLEPSGQVLKGLCAYNKGSSQNSLDRSWQPPLAEALVLLTEAHGLSVDLLLIPQVQADVERSGSDDDFLRSFAFQLLLVYFRLLCPAYLADTLGSSLADFVAQPQVFALDLHADGSNSAEVMAQYDALIRASASLLSKILRSLSQGPEVLWTLVRALLEAATRAGSRYSGGLALKVLFSALFIPAIEFPDAYNMLTEQPLSPAARAQLKTLRDFFAAVVTGIQYPPHPHANFDAVNVFSKKSFETASTFVNRWTKMKPEPEKIQYPSEVDIPWGAYSLHKEKSMNGLHSFIFNSYVGLKDCFENVDIDVLVEARYDDFFAYLIPPLPVPLPSESAAVAALKAEDKKALKKKSSSIRLK